LGGDDSSWITTDYPLQGRGDKTAGVAFAVSTVGFSQIVVSWDHWTSWGGADSAQFQYSMMLAGLAAVGWFARRRQD